MGQELFPIGGRGDICGVNFSRVNVQTVLTLFWKLDGERDLTISDGLTDKPEINMQNYVYG